MWNKPQNILILNDRSLFILDQYNYLLDEGHGYG